MKHANAENELFREYARLRKAGQVREAQAVRNKTVEQNLGLVRAMRTRPCALPLGLTW